MFTMGLAVRIVTEWIDDPSALVEYSCRFTRPVPVPDDNVGALLVVNAKVAELLPDNQVVFSLSATCDSVAVLGKARVIVQLKP
jgi:acyl dehydratase